MTQYIEHAFEGSYGVDHIVAGTRDDDGSHRSSYSHTRACLSLTLSSLEVHVYSTLKKMPVRFPNDQTRRSWACTLKDRKSKIHGRYSGIVLFARCTPISVSLASPG